jgi:hypothetical protein
MPFFPFLGLTDAVLFGLGATFLVFGLPVWRRVSPDPRAMYLSIGYLMVSCWPRLNMHASNGLDLQGLLYIDYLSTCHSRPPGSYWLTASSRW